MTTRKITIIALTGGIVLGAAATEGFNMGSPPKQNDLKAALFLAFWIWALNWLFSRYARESYLMWYVRNGTLISTATAFVALLWGKLEEEQKKLLSWHPATFVATCMALTGLFCYALGSSLRRQRTDGGAGDFLSIVEFLWDDLFSIIMSLLMFVAVLGWLFVVAPLFYLLTLITGAPARLEIRKTGLRLIYRRKGSVTGLQQQPFSEPVPDGWVDISLGNHSFALTNALNAAVLFLANLLISHSH